MLITHTPRQTHENTPTSPCNHGKENTQADNADAPQAIVGGSRAIVDGSPPSRYCQPPSPCFLSPRSRAFFASRF